MEVSEVEKAIKHLDVNKTCGMDGIYAEHLKHCNKHILPLILAMCIFLCFDFYLILCYLLCWCQLSKINVAK